MDVLTIENLLIVGAAVGIWMAYEKLDHLRNKRKYKKKRRK
jgi:hypothetical protein